MLTLGIACLLVTFMAFALAQPREPRVANFGAGSASEGTEPAFDPAVLPTLDSIDAQTDIAIFLQGGVPARLQLAALRRAWTPPFQEH